MREGDAPVDRKVLPRYIRFFRISVRPISEGVTHTDAHVIGASSPVTAMYRRVMSPHEALKLHTRGEKIPIRPGMT